jgi:putative transposase
VARLTPKILNLSGDEREQLQKLINKHNTPQQIAIRAKIILMASEGKNHREIARNLDINRQMARLWRNRGSRIIGFSKFTRSRVCWHTSKI